jgi:2-polyprenyl-3-methyl-5-hydroxy-6-metoxy-1,4-benzoquinol methylase
MIDILIFLSLSPKILILTKDWVWNNPVFGFVVRFSGHINISEGYENVIEKIQERVREGCSILVFAEGSRTDNGEIKRFHKGGFYLAQELKMPVKKILVHGVMEVLPRSGFMLSPGCMTVIILGSIRIPDNDPRAYYTISKETSKSMRVAYDELRREIETPQYLSNRLLANYVYKGPVVENYMKIKLRLEKYYELYDNLIPRKAFITDIGCGYGPISFMLGLRSSERKILAIDYDEEKVTLAKNCELANQLHIDFVNADASIYSLPESDVFLISDMLHYLPTEKQSMLIKNCLDKLNYNGSIIVRDGDNLLKRQHLRTRLSEFFSTHIGFNKADSNLSFFSSIFVKEFAAKYGLGVEIIDNSKLTSNRIYVLTRNQDEK